MRASRAAPVAEGAMLKGAEANCVTVNGDCPREGRSPRGTRYTCLPLGGARAGLVVGEIVPRTAVLALILADRAPLAFHRATPWRRSWGRRISLAPAPRGGEDQVRQSATTEFRFGSRLMVARRRRAGTRALGDAAADHCPDHYNSIKRSGRRRRRKGDRNRVHAALVLRERTFQPTPE